jgi:hypothetical protein
VATLVRVLSPKEVLDQVDDRWDPPVHMAKDQKVDYFIWLPQDLNTGSEQQCTGTNQYAANWFTSRKGRCSISGAQACTLVDAADEDEDTDAGVEAAAGACGQETIAAGRRRGRWRRWRTCLRCCMVTIEMVQRKAPACRRSGRARAWRGSGREVAGDACLQQRVLGRRRRVRARSAADARSTWSARRRSWSRGQG